MTNHQLHSEDPWLSWNGTIGLRRADRSVRAAESRRGGAVGYGLVERGANRDRGTGTGAGAGAARYGARGAVGRPVGPPRPVQSTSAW